MKIDKDKVIKIPPIMIREDKSIPEKREIDLLMAQLKENINIDREIKFVNIAIILFLISLGFILGGLFFT